jgi:putative hemolysin
VALRLMEDPVRVISATQIAITFLGILLGAVGEPVLRELLGDGIPTWAAFALAFLAITYLSVAFGELVPKAFALYAPERVAIFVARPVDLFARLTGPAVWVLQLSTRAVLAPLGVPAVGVGERPISREELRGVLQEAEEHGTLGAEEEDMLTGVIDLRLREVADIMRPWDDVDVVRLDQPPEEELDRMLGAAHTRFPAIEGDNDVVGVLHARDAWVAWRSSADGSPPDLRSLVRDAVIVPPSVRVDALLRMLRRARQQMAIVVDEYGRPAGIATLEDILEEIVGEIEDEFDELDERFERIGDDEWLVDGAVSVSDFNRRTDAELDAGRARSIGGLVFEHFGRMPRAGESFEIDGVTLTVEQLDGHRIALVRARISRERSAAA